MRQDQIMLGLIKGRDLKVRTDRMWALLNTEVEGEIMVLFI